MENKDLEKMENMKRWIETLMEENKKLKEEIKMSEMLMEKYHFLIYQGFNDFQNLLENFGSYEILDPLTRVFSFEHFLNYTKFYHSLAQRKEKSYTIVRLKFLNYGHICGEKSNEICNYALLKIVSVLKKKLRIPLDVVGRISQNSFAILIVEVEEDGAKKILKRITDSIMNNDFVVNNTNVDVELETAFLSFPDDISTADDIEKFLEG
jgi:GGDEF domain-containing protein